MHAEHVASSSTHVGTTPVDETAPETKSFNSVPCHSNAVRIITRRGITRHYRPQGPHSAGPTCPLETRRV